MARCKSRITKGDLALGDVVENRHGNRAVVTQLESGDGEERPNLESGEFGYNPDVDAAPVGSETESVASVRIIKSIVGKRPLASPEASAQ